ncbi:hypothetical protein LCGC14_2495770 [marine sediment metagenome]|uniref:Uncharacterized protein n=1 Tax=marine sediment metagenome TaxID=412755 RepID=A0A0F9B3B6_9ZZZZ
MQLTKLETEILLKALELKKLKGLEQVDEWKSLLEAKRLSFELNTLNRMIKSVENGKGLSCGKYI